VLVLPGLESCYSCTGGGPHLATWNFFQILFGWVLCLHSLAVGFLPPESVQCQHGEVGVEVCVYELICG
jgi:hypothetical protein